MNTDPERERLLNAKQADILAAKKLELSRSQKRWDDLLGVADEIYEAQHAYTEAKYEYEHYRESLR
jgi:hypothetical protein